eukprot:gene9897-10910_t
MISENCKKFSVDSLLNDGRGKTDSEPYKCSSYSFTEQSYASCPRSEFPLFSTSQQYTTRSKVSRSRVIFSAEQLEKLERSFGRKQYPGVGKRDRLAKTLNLTETRVRVWFQNRRAKWRRKEKVSRLQAFFYNQLSERACYDMSYSMATNLPEALPYPPDLGQHSEYNPNRRNVESAEEEMERCFLQAMIDDVNFQCNGDLPNSTYNGDDLCDILPMQEPAAPSRCPFYERYLLTTN